MAPVKVDLTMVQSMADRYNTCAGAVADLDTTTATANLPAALPATDTGRFAGPVGKRVDDAFDATGNRIRKMAQACRIAADTYERTDQASAAALARKGVL